MQKLDQVTLKLHQGQQLSDVTSDVGDGGH